MIYRFIFLMCEAKFQEEIKMSMCETEWENSFFFFF